MAPPSREPVVSLPDKEHLVHHVGKVRVESQKRIKTGIGFLPEVAPGGINIFSDIQHLIMVVVDGDIQRTVAVAISGDEFVLKSLHIYLIDRSNKRQSSHATERYTHSRLCHWLDAKYVDYSSRILLLLETERDFALIGIRFSGRLGRRGLHN